MTIRSSGFTKGHVTQKLLSKEHWGGFLKALYVSALEIICCPSGCSTYLNLMMLCPRRWNMFIQEQSGSGSLIIIPKDPLNKRVLPIPVTLVSATL